MNEDGLKRALASGARWTTAARVAAEMSLLGASLALARLIPPAEFGRAAIALVLVNIAAMLVAEGLGTPLVQRRSIERAHIEGALTTSIAFGALLALALFALVPPLCEPLFGERTSDLIRLATLGFVFSGIRVVPDAMLQRALDFRRIAIIEMISIMTGVVTSVTLAATGVDGEALVLGILAQLAVAALLALLAVPLPAPRLRRREAAELLGFGSRAALATITNTTQRNVDYVILGAQLSAAQVGFYYRAFQLGVDYQRKISFIMQRVAFPIYSRTESIDELRNLRARIVQVQASVIVPLLALFVVIAPELVPWVFGSAWEPAVLPAQILAVAGAAGALLAGFPPLIVALGRPGALLAYNASFLAAFVVAVVIAAPHGLTAVCITVSAVNLAGVVAVHHLLLDRIAGIPFSQLWRDIGPAASASVALGAAALLVHELASAAALSAPLLIVSVGLAGAAAYAVSLKVIFPRTWSDLRSLAQKVLPDARRTGPAVASPALARSSTIPD